MPDSKITALTAITTVNPATFPLVIVDTSDTSMAITGTTKKVTTNQLLGSGGTATLASATISGDLTVDTNTLKVDSANNRVGVGTASPSASFHTNSDGVASGAGWTAIGRFNNVAQTKGIDLGYNPSNNNAVITALSGGATSGFEWWSFDGGWANRMTLNATGLGVGVVPDRKLHVGSNVYPQIRLVYTGVNTYDIGVTSGGVLALNHTSTTNGLVLDQNANVGIGVTPSAWAAGFKVIQVGSGPSISTNGNASRCDISTNYYYNGGNKFLTASGYATGISQENGNFYFQRSTTTSGGIGSSLTFDVPMTLDASGNLLVGTTTNIGAARLRIAQTGTNNAIYVSGDFNTPLINFCGAGLFRSDGAYLSLQTNSTGGVIYITPNTGGVYISPGNTSWTANSDERLKDIIEPISNAVAKVGSLRSVIGKWKTDPDGTRRSFLIAQDAQTAFPEVVDKNADGMLGIRYTEVIPLLVAAIKELTARVQTLETR